MQTVLFYIPYQQCALVISLQSCGTLKDVVLLWLLLILQQTWILLIAQPLNCAIKVPSLYFYVLHKVVSSCQIYGQLGKNGTSTMAVQPLKVDGSPAVCRLLGSFAHQIVLHRKHYFQPRDCHIFQAKAISMLSFVDQSKPMIEDQSSVSIKAESMKWTQSWLGL